MSNKNNSFTEGSVLSALLKFAGPVLFALVLQAAYGAVDLLIVGRFGDASGISAVGTGSAFMQMITFIITSLAMGSTVIIGRHIGENRPKAAGDAVGTSIVMFVAISVVMTIVLEIFAGQAAGILHVPAESYDKTIQYIRICSGGILFIVAYNVISGILRGIGNSKLPLIFVAIACAVNIIGDLLLVGLLKMDAAGAAIATITAQAVSVVISALVIRKQKMPVKFGKSQIKIFRNELRMILNVGIPITLQELLVQISFLVINAVINNMGLMQSAGYGVAQKLISFVMLVPAATMQSVSAFVAQNVGAGKPERAKQSFFCAIKVGMSIGVFIFLAAFFGGGLISSVFSDDADVIAQSWDYIRGFSVDCILTCILFSSIGYFNGNGRSIPVMIQGITSAFLIRIPVSVLMSKLPDTNLTLVGLSTPITTVYGIIFFIVCLKKYSDPETHLLIPRE